MEGGSTVGCMYGVGGRGVRWLLDRTRNEVQSFLLTTEDVSFAPTS